MIDVIVPVHGLAETTLRCFRSVIKHTPKVRIIWIDNDSSEDEFMKIVNGLSLDEWKSVDCVPFGTNLGFIKATNTGLKISESDPICLMNNDVEVFAGWYDRMKKHLDENKEIGIIAAMCSEGKHVNCVNNMGLSRGELSHENYAAKMAKEGGVVIKKGMVPFSCVLIRRKCFEDVGYLDESYGIGFGDDDDYCRRATDKGWKLAIATDAYIYHQGRTTFKHLNLPWEKMEVEAREQFLKKYGKSP